MTKTGHNYAFLDGQNLHRGLVRAGWTLDYRRLRVHLAEKYAVRVAYLFLGFIPENHKLYTALREAGYDLVFKPVVRRVGAKPKGNVDAEIVLQAMIDLHRCERAVLVTSDGDFACLVHYLRMHGRLETVLSVERNTASVLLRKAAGERIRYLERLRLRLEARK